MAEVTTPIITDTTGQSIASAISGLGATLGSDRALINGSNIVDKATFRQNIGACGVVVSGSTTATTDSSGRILVVGVPVSSMCLRFWAIGFIVGGYRNDMANPNNTLVYIRTSDNSQAAANTSVTLCWDYISS